MSGICVLSTVAKILGKIILKYIKKHLERLINKEKASFRPGSTCIGHNNLLMKEALFLSMAESNLMLLDVDDDYAEVRVALEQREVEHWEEECKFFEKSWA